MVRSEHITRDAQHISFRFPPVTPLLAAALPDGTGTSLQLAHVPVENGVNLMFVRPKLPAL